MKGSMPFIFFSHHPTIELIHLDEWPPRQCWVGRYETRCQRLCRESASHSSTSYTLRSVHVRI